MHKLRLDETSEATYELPAGAEIRHVACQHGQDVTLWYEFDLADLETPVARTFAIVGTGIEEVEDAWTFLGTVIFTSGKSVFHVYEV